MKVYLVFVGVYSDRYCKAVFDSEEQAKILSKEIEKMGEDSDIEEFELNESKAENLKFTTCYRTYISFADDLGEHFRIYKKSSFECEEILDISKPNVIEFKDIDSFYPKCNKQILVKSLISKEHAEKIALEQYQIYTQQQLENLLQHENKQ